MSERCNDCDPSFECWNGSAACGKREILVAGETGRFRARIEAETIAAVVR